MDRPFKGWTTAFLLLLAAGSTYVSPRLSRYRPISRESLVRIFIDPFRGRPRSPMVSPPLPVYEPGEAALLPMPEGSPARPKATPAPVRRHAKASSPRPEALQEDLLEDASGALATFQDALHQAEAGGGQVRITHFGDSPITGDLISGEARSRFQKLFGDAGHGWILAGRPWEWYGHRGITLQASGWKVNAPALTGRRDRSYGFGGATFTATAGAHTKLAMAKGTGCSRAELHYLAQPKSGNVVVTVDDGEPQVLATRGEAGPARHALKLEGDGPHTITLKPAGDGEVTLFGLVLERDRPGVVYDAVGANGGAIQHLARMDPDHWIQSLQLRRPDLVILGFGTNECGYYNIPGPGYVQDYREVVKRIRKALPKVSILIMAPMDRGQRNPEGGIETIPALMRIVEAQRQIAAELRCAFFDTFRAMGGEGAAGRWYLGTPRLMTGDLIHPTHPGADRVASLLVEALQQDYAASPEVLPGLQEEGTVAEARPKGGHHRARSRRK